ncbi:MAG: hypothetical protein QOJ16_4218 [Acidobacteriota bacterium]|jgi:hypothetical protein|nr:hypothetical protein [Acidobacteriota bacterium]
MSDIPYKQLFILVEGGDDVRFFGAVVKPLFEKYYDEVRILAISNWSHEEVRRLLFSISAMKSDYLIVRDIDTHPCVTAARDALRKPYSRLDPERIQIVRAEIESWYCAGISPQDAELGALKVVTCNDTGEVTKESFDAALFERRLRRAPAMIAMLERFDLATAARRNASFRYFLRKHLDLDPS